MAAIPSQTGSHSNVRLASSSNRSKLDTKSHLVESRACVWLRVVCTCNHFPVVCGFFPCFYVHVNFLFLDEKTKGKKKKEKANFGCRYAKSIQSSSSRLVSPSIMRALFLDQIRDRTGTRVDHILLFTGSASCLVEWYLSG